MGIAVDIVQFTLNTSTGTQDITGSLGGLTPKAALFFVTRATANGTPASDAAMSYGAATGASNEWVFQFNSEDGQTDTDTRKISSSSRCILLTIPGAATIDMDAEFSAWITNGIRINITTSDAVAYKGTVVLFAGSDLQAHANNVSLGDTVDLETNITAPGFEPKLIFPCANPNLVIDNTASTAEISFGIVHNGVSLTQRGHSFMERNAQVSGNVRGMVRNDYGVFEIGSDGTLDWGGEFANFDASGFSVISRNAGANNTTLGYLALDFGGVVDISLSSQASPTSTGNNAITTPGFTPQAVIGLQTYMPAYNTVYNQVADAGAWGVVAFTDSTDLCNSIAIESGAATTNTQSYTNTKAVDVPNDDGTVALTADFVSMDANGWTLNWTDVEAAGRQGFFVAIEEEAAVAAAQFMTTQRGYW